MFSAVNDVPDIYLDELQMELKEAFGVSADKSTIWRALRRKGYTMKKVCNSIYTIARVHYLTPMCPQLSRVAIERSAEKRAEFGVRIGTYEAEQLIFVDESAVDRRTTYRGRAWAIRGSKATRKAFFVRGKRCVTIHSDSVYALNRFRI